jgi:hypothetical protein
MKDIQIKIFLRSFLNILMLLISLFFSNCNLTTGSILTAKDTIDLKKSKIIWIMLKDGNSIIFDKNGGSYINKKEFPSEYIAGTSSAGNVVEIKLNEVYKIQIEKEPASEYIAWILIPTLIFFLILKSI